MTTSITMDRISLLEGVGRVGRLSRMRTVLDDVTLHIPKDVYLLVGDEVDRRSIIDLVTGRRNAASGTMTVSGSCSYAIGRTNSFAVAVTGEDMVRFLADLYAFDVRFALARLVEILPEADVLRTRLDKCQPSQRLALSLACAQFIDPDVLVFDGVFAHPSFPESFLRHVGEMFPLIMAGRMVILSSRQMTVARSLARQTLVVANGKLWIGSLQESQRPTSEAELLPAGQTELQEDELEIL